MNIKFTSILIGKTINKIKKDIVVRHVRPCEISDHVYSFGYYYYNHLLLE